MAATGEDTQRATLRRRGLIAGAAALAAGLLATRTAAPVSATHQPEDVGLGIDNTVANNQATRIIAPAGFASGSLLVFAADGSAGGGDITAIKGIAGGTGNGLVSLAQGVTAASSNVPAGVYTEVSAASTYGLYAKNTGMYGRGVQANCPGVNATALQGVAPNAQGVGCFALGGSIGVSAISTSAYGYAMYGLINDQSPAIAYSKAIYGINQGGGAGNVGVQGECDHGIGVYGSTRGTGVVAGVYGNSSTAYGVIGNTSAAGYSGLTAITSTAGVAALAATSTNANAYAAYFQGTTVVQGNFAVVGGAKSAAVPHPDGSHRLVFCIESPENWFEDFGEAKLVNGRAEVKLDSDFAALVHTDAYHVFLITYGEEGSGLNVAERHADGFVVKERNKGSSTLTFGWRMVAKRKDIAAKRLAKMDLLKINTPDPAKLPK